MKKVFVLISDENYLEHAKSLFNSAREIGKWDGDLCLIANDVPENKLIDFKKFGVEIFPIKEKNFYYANFHIFDKYMKKWDYLISMDCDFTIFGELNNLFSDDILMSDSFYVDKEPFTVKSYFCWAVVNGEVRNEMCGGREKFFEELSQYYDLERNGFNAGFMSFNTKLISDTTLDDLYSLAANLQSINFHTSPNGSDQPILNLYFMDKVRFIENQKISFWKLSTETTIAQHHCRWEAPWVNNFFSKRLNSSYHQNYQKNLINFYASINKL